MGVSGQPKAISYAGVSIASFNAGLTRLWRELGLGFDEADFTDAQAVAAIVQITEGNLRLLHRLFVQIGRILRINGLHAITEEVVQAARSTLVIGAT